MGNKLKEFLFPSKDKNEFETSTVEISRQEINSQPTITSFNASTGSESSPLIIKPKTFVEVESIALELINHRTVIVDLTSTNLDEAKRICDFLNGVTYAINGEVKKAAKLVYMFSPVK